MPYLNLDLDYFEHPKTRRLVGLLGNGSAEIPIRLWCYVGKYHPESGHLTGYSLEEIEGVIGWWGDSGKAIEALLRVGFISKRGRGFYTVHDWLDHSGHLGVFKKRGMDGAKARWGKAKAMQNDESSNAYEGDKQYPSSTIPTKPTEEHKPPPLQPPFFDEACKAEWENFRGHRVEIRKKMTPRSEKLLLVRLAELSKGNPIDAVKIIQRSIANGWQGIFELKENQNGPRQAQPGSQAARASFRHGPEELKRLDELKATLDARDRERNKRAGSV